MSKYEFKGNHVELTEIPKKFKKLTATRFGTVLGLNRWNTPFSAWCEMTKTYEDPFAVFTARAMQLSGRNQNEIPRGDGKQLVLNKVIPFSYPKIIEFIRRVIVHGGHIKTSGGSADKKDRTHVGRNGVPVH